MRQEQTLEGRLGLYGYFREDGERLEEWLDWALRTPSQPTAENRASRQFGV